MSIAPTFSSGTMEGTQKLFGVLTPSDSGLKRV